MGRFVIGARIVGVRRGRLDDGRRRRGYDWNGWYVNIGASGENGVDSGDAQGS